MTSKFLCPLVVVLMLSACQPAQVSIRPVMDWQQADAARAKGDFYKLGKTYLKSSDIGLAIDAFRQDLSLRGDNIKSLNGLGVAYDMLGRYDLSQKYYERALDLDPASSMTFSNLAYSQYMQGEYAAAVALADKAKEALAPPAAERNILNNLEAAGEKKIKEEEPGAAGDSASYQVERVGERRWEISRERRHRAVKPPVRYRSAITLQQILDRAKMTKEVKIQKTARAGMPGCRIVNGVGRPKMAKRLASFLDGKGLPACRLGNAVSYDHSTSVIEFSPGRGEEAKNLALALPIFVQAVEVRNLKDKVRLTIGADILPFDTSLSSNNGAL